MVILYKEEYIIKETCFTVYISIVMKTFNEELKESVFQEGKVRHFICKIIFQFSILLLIFSPLKLGAVKILNLNGTKNFHFFPKIKFQNIKFLFFHNWDITNFSIFSKNIFLTKNYKFSKFHKKLLILSVFIAKTNSRNSYWYTRYNFLKI